MPMATLYAMLLDAGVRPWEVQHLTNWQIARILQHPRDRFGQVKREAGARQLSLEVFREMMADRGLSEEEIARRWRRIKERGRP